MPDDLEKKIGRSLRRQITIAFVLIIMIMGAFGAVTAVAKISGAVIGSGRIIVEGRSKQVQHRDGGIVREILVAEGEKVEAGDLLFRLDDTIMRAELMMVQKQLVEFEARRARLHAERDGLTAVEFGQLAGGGDAADRAKAGEANLFAARRDSRIGQVSQLKERISQHEMEVEGVLSQVDAKEGEIELIASELSSLRKLLKQGLIEVTRVTSLEREETRLRGELGQLRAEVARTRGRITETNLQILQIEQDMRTEVVAELRDVDAQLAQLAERKIAAEDQLRRIEIHAPIAGLVHELAVHTVGGVIAAGDTALRIVPTNDELIVEAELSPNDVDQVSRAQRARLRLTGLDQRVTPELSAHIIDISPDLVTDPQTGSTYYVARLRIDDTEIDKIGRERLLPGMPVEVFVQTHERSILSYLTKPITDQIEHALREA